MQVLRTPEERFADLPDLPYEPHYAEVADPDGGTLRMAFVAAGPSDGPVVVLLHGEPTWSYLYRTMIPPLAEAGLRVIAPDLIGFGRSDKPAASLITATPATSAGSLSCCSSSSRSAG